MNFKSKPKFYNYCNNITKKGPTICIFTIAYKRRFLLLEKKLSSSYSFEELGTLINEFETTLKPITR